MRVQEAPQRSGEGEGREQYSEEMRTFVFQKEQTHQSLLLDIKIRMFQESVDLSSLFAQYCPLHQHKVAIYDPEINSFVQLSKIGADVNGRIPLGLLQTQIIMIRFKRRQEQAGNTESDSGIESGLEESREKKDRSKERTIGESIQLVKRWRALHLDSIKSGMKKMSLSEAARAVGVSKKSLDDYYYQLRLGEFYNFDFTNNLHEKVGILRGYVKAFKPQREQRNKNLRHPKNLRVIESFDQYVPNILKEPEQAVPQSPMYEQVKSPASFKSLSLQQQSFQSFESKSNPFLNDVMSSYQDKFFKNFEFLLDDPNDPFIEISHNFKKKAAEDNNDFFFF